MSDQPAAAGEKPDARTYFAAERTLLAWIRTGLSMMGFGFVVARFGLFLREMEAIPGKPPMAHTGFSLWIGTLLVLMGVMVNLVAAYTHVVNLNRLQRGEVLRFSPWSLGLFAGILLAVIGLLMAAYLVLGISH
jgi:putative membrane protein